MEYTLNSLTLKMLCVLNIFCCDLKYTYFDVLNTNKTQVLYLFVVFYLILKFY